MKKSLEKLQSLLIGKSYDKTLIDNFVSYLDKMGNGLVFPGSAALSIQTDPKTINELFLIASAERVFNHFVVPKYNGSILQEYKTKGFDLPEDLEIQDPDDFETIDRTDLEIISAYQIVEI